MRGLGSMKHVTGLCLLALVFHAGVLLAQEVRARVTTILKTLPLEKQERLADFGAKIERYINEHTWFEDPDITVEVQMQWMLEDISSSSEERYRAQILVSNNTDIQYFDKRCRFAYNPNEPIVHNEPAFTSLTALIDFYVYLIIAGEMDKYGTLAGTPYYRKALDIAQQARYGLGRFNEGWDLRLELARKLLSDEHKPFREMVDYYFYGLSLKSDDIEQARKYVGEAVRRLASLLEKDPKDEFCHKFLDAHHIEIVDLFSGAADKSIFQLLMNLDPDHADTYKQYVE
ncbi:MAG: DUF4835 family protein [candidate division KSB1 bacterium]|nr:DUF4835 family protein [candidate division KSB1 bacterium]